MCGMQVDPAKAPPPASTGQDLLLLREDLQDEVRREPESMRQILTTTHQHPEPPEGVLDPVCGMRIDPADAVGHFDYQGQTYFCAELPRAVSREPGALPQS